MQEELKKNKNIIRKDRQNNKDPEVKTHNDGQGLKSWPSKLALTFQVDKVKREFQAIHTDLR